MTIQHTFAPTADVASLSLVPLNVAGMAVFELLTRSHSNRDDPKIISDTLYWRNFITEWLFKFINTLPLFLPVFQCFREEVEPFVQNHRLLPGFGLRLRARVGADKILPTPTATPTRAKSAGSGRLQPAAPPLNMKIPLRLVGSSQIWHCPLRPYMGPIWSSMCLFRPVMNPGGSVSPVWVLSSLGQGRHASHVPAQAQHMDPVRLLLADLRAGRSSRIGL